MLLEEKLTFIVNLAREESGTKSRQTRATVQRRDIRYAICSSVQINTVFSFERIFSSRARVLA